MKTQFTDRPPVARQVVQRLIPYSGSSPVARLLKPKPVLFSQANLKIDYNCQLGFHCLHLLIEREYYLNSIYPLTPYTPFDCTSPELLELQTLLPCRDPEQPSAIDSSQFVLSHAQYKMLRKCLTKELRYLATYATSRLRDVSVFTLKNSLTALAEAMLNSTKILTTDELCS